MAAIISFLSDNGNYKNELEIETHLEISRKLSEAKN